MAEITRTVKLRLYTDPEQSQILADMSSSYMQVCNYISEYIFNNGFNLNSIKIQEKIYKNLREIFELKSQMCISAIKTVTAKYKTIKEQQKQNPYHYKTKDGRWEQISKTLEWLWKPVIFRKPQADLVRGRDYSFVENKEMLSLNTLKKRIHLTFAKPETFDKYFDGTWSFGTGKIVCTNGIWYFHMPVTKKQDNCFDSDMPKHVVGIDRGLRFLAVTYDEKGRANFFDGKKIIEKRDRFQKVRAELQSRGTKSAKRVLKRLSERENRWMSDVNHRISKTLVERYGRNTLFVLEDLKGVSFSDGLLSDRTKEQRQHLRTWAFYQFEQFLIYKAKETSSGVIKVSPRYTSQRCPKCGRIHKDNRKKDIHEYICDSCGYRSNDDRIGAMNLQFLGTLYVSGNPNLGFARKEK